MKQHITHPIPPFYDENSEILILGSFPSDLSGILKTAPISCIIVNGKTAEK